MILKKKFFEIELPIIKHTVELIATNEEELIGKTIKLDLTRRLRGKSVEAVFKILKSSDFNDVQKSKDKKISDIKEKVIAVPQRLYLLGYFIRRMMRKSIDYVEDSFSAESKDAILRIKPFLITRKRVSRAVRNALRNKAKEEIIKEIKNKNIEEIFSEILNNKFQRTLSLKLKKVYPLAFCDIRDIFVEKMQELKIKEEKVK